ncbi:hypothetical protein GCM10008927_27300 [Amylibacter ulvae]|uniref:Uncharacterized protein n=1 Tax=Paramylibacter ulvae TaxID=1651968 RepID=A0ABQ3D5W0_9RHOB|nr:hypothetical protein [Amylibacter ulvae]GHA60310.1 hypothetical protein GCM10008927_27300 [Amylibacter ulvae]
MNHSNSYKQQEAIIDWLNDKNWQVFGTLKFLDGHSISKEIAEKDINNFFNRLDRTYLGSNLVKDNNRIERFVFYHTGKSGSNIHFHFLAKPNCQIDFFCKTAKCLWEATSKHSVPYEHLIIDEIRSKKGATRYCLHEYPKLGENTLYLPATHRKPTAMSSNSLHRIRRLLKQQEKNEIIIENSRRRTSKKK